MTEPELKEMDLKGDETREPQDVATSRDEIIRLDVKRHDVEDRIGDAYQRLIELRQRAVALEQVDLISLSNAPEMTVLFRIQPLQTLSELSCDVEQDDVINLLMRAHKMEEELLEEQLHNVNTKFELE